MPADPEIPKLLALQEVDTQRIEAERALAGLPRERAMLEGKINAVNDELKKAHGRLEELELKRASMRTERLSLEDQLQKYKMQQMQVKKNDEYTALGHEIDELSKKLDTWEEEELGVLMEIDEAKVALEPVREQAAKRIVLLEAEQAKLVDRETTLEAQCVELKKAVDEKAQGIKPKYLRTYENVRLRYKTPPFVVPIVDRKVKGLRVSGEVETQARQGEDVATDDNSGYIVYFP